MTVAFPYMGVAIIRKRTDSAGSVQALKNSTLIYAPPRGAAVSQLNQLLLQRQQAGHACLHMLNVLIH